MNKKLLVVLAFLCSMIFTLTACTGEKENESNEIKNSESNENESNNSPVQGSQTLNVITLSRPGYHQGINTDMKNKIKDAMLEIYPDYELNLTTFTDDDSYNSNIQVSLMSGQPYDLVFAYEKLQIEKFIENEYFKDIYELIEKDKSVSIDDYYVNALKAYESDGKLYRMPISFVYDYLIGINAKLPPETINNYKKSDGISVKSMFDIYKQNKDGNNLDIINNIKHSKLIEPSIASYINFENKTCDFNSDRFKVLLIDIRDSMFSAGYDIYYQNVKYSNFYTQDDDIVSGDKSMFTIHDMQQGLIDYAVPYFEHFIPLTNENDKLIISSKAVYCIGNTANAEMAWDFLKHYINMYNDDSSLAEVMHAMIPIKKDLFYYKATMYMTGAVVANTGISIRIGDIMIGGGYGSGYGGNLLYDTDTTISRGIEKLEKFNEKPMISVQQIDTDGSLYLGVIDNFMKDLITVDQAAQQIQNAMSLYLSE